MRMTMTARSSSNIVVAVLVTVAASGCARHRPDVVGPQPAVDDPRRWLAPGVRLVADAGEPVFAVEGQLWLSRRGQWLRWHADGWRWASAPTALELLPSYRDLPFQHLE